MPAVTTIDLGPVGLYSVKRFRATIKKDGVTWDLSSGSVQFVFEKPDRSTQLTFAGIAESAVSGIFYYDTTTLDLDTVGLWTLNVRVTDGTVVDRYPYEIGFEVVDYP